MIWKLLLITIVLMAIAFALIAIKMFIQKGGVFTKTCSSDIQDDKGRSMSCGCNGDCENYELHHGKGAIKK